MTPTALTIMVLTTISLSTHAVQPICFSLAETYYEQVYCQVRQEAPETALPSFSDFRRNEPSMQALLLKRKAAALGIEVMMPAADVRKSTATERVSTVVEKTQNVASTSCALDGKRIQCGGEVFVQTGNLANSRLPAQALTPANQLRLPPLAGNGSSREQKMHYLSDAYVRYLESMLSIGLGGETMSFTKFYYLYEDVTSKGADFVQRFRTMFEYLKKDKQSLDVNETVAEISGIGIEQCERLTEVMFTCDNKRRNAVFLRE